MSIQSVVQGLGRKPEPWTRQTFTMPMPIKAGDLTSIGDIRGRAWYSHPKFGELAERGVVSETDRALPDGPIVEVRRIDPDAPRRYRTFDVHAPGTFARLSSVVRAPKLPKPHRPVDVLGHIWLAAARPERIAASPVGVGIRAAEAAADGPAAILARLDEADVQVRLSVDDADLVISTRGGVLAPGLLELIDRSGPMLGAYLRGAPLMCNVSRHQTPQVAVRRTLGGAWACRPCLEGAA